MTHAKRLFVGGVVAMALAACGGAATVGDGETTTSSTGVALATTPTTATETVETVTTTTTEATPTTVTGAVTTPMAPTTTNGGIVGSTTTEASGQQNPLIAQAITDLAARLGVDESEIEVVGIEDVEWPDASLGCPDPKKSYAQVLVDGYDIILSAGGAEYHYHGGGGSGPFYCAIPTS